MSGAEAAIAGIGFLCNAMQIVTFGRDILQVYKHVRDEHSPDPRLKAYLENAKACFDDMNSSTSQVLPSTRDQQQIIDIGKKLEESMTQLQSKFSELHIDDTCRRGFRGKVDMLRKALASLWQGKELESLETNLKRYESLLHGIVLHRICSQSQAAEISSKDVFNKLDTGLQSIITQLADGCTRVSELSIESLKTRNLVTQEHKSTRAVIIEGFTTAQGAISSFRDSMTQELQDIAGRDQSRNFEKEHNELLQCIRFPEMNSRKNHISENYPGTFDWVFENLDDDEDLDDTLDSPMPANTTRPADLNCFPAWLESSAQQFWVSGKPASGKSSLMKFLAINPLTLQHLQAQHRNIQILTHYFWKPGQPLQKNVEGMTRSLLYQLLHRNRGLAQRLCAEQPTIQDKKDHGDWDMNELKKALCWAIKFSGNTFCIFLDGLDEAKEFEDLPFGDNQNTQVIYDLLKLDNIKLCASSREEDPFIRFFAGQPRLRTHRLNENDIRHYAKNRLELSGLCSHHRFRLLLTVVQKANGVFLWVVLVVKSLNQAIRSGGTNEFEERLAQTPSDLHDLLVDMWSRPGDEAKLSTYELDASRIFNLVLTATKIGVSGYTDSSEMIPFHWMRSTLVMATALEDKPFLSVLRESGQIQVQELLARCARVQDRLRLVCRGLLEVTTPEDVDRPCAGNEALYKYSLRRIDFIHRCAFDFMTDTQFGRQCLTLCHWSTIEQVERLLVGHLIKSRFLRYKSKRYDMQIAGKRTRSGSNCEFFRPPALNISLNWTDYDMYFRNSMFKELRDWQQRGLFYYDHLHLEGSILAPYPSNSRGLDFIEHVVRTANSGALLSDLLDQVSDVSLLEAIPALLCALVNYNGSIAMGSCLNFVDYVLTRLESETDRGRQDVSSQGQRDVRNETRLLHSWFVMQCLHGISTDWSNDRHKIIDLLHRFSHTLSLPSDWQRPLVLEYGVSDDLSVLPKSGEEHEFGFRQYTLAIGNFVTAYHLLGQRLPDLVGCALHIRPPQDAKGRFEIIVNRLNEDSSDGDKDSFHLQEVIIGVRDIADCIKENLPESGFST
ncbi:uncharacterized protein FTJAE_7213 [Fusarium tjaetaba]|uniref:Small s protein n=1 Tax=Fusarium tjaetaba TaxID=1567544 RepID=A0A8H5VRW3_9HYPO|nr:uncharacterized protein FTJAE_7213 [Fusarium tjaetaba]KAF5633316.1 hypothetical protein FTJAE_7213 [Fusarium tjaetaba]